MYNILFKSTFQEGQGIYTWPNGATYEGHFIQEDKESKGVEKYTDRTRGKGNFVNDMRH